MKNIIIKLTVKQFYNYLNNNIFLYILKNINYLLYKNIIIEMGCECEWGNKQCEIFIRILNTIAGAYLIALGILRFIFNAQLTNFLSFLLSVYYMY